MEYPPPLQPLAATMLDQTALASLQRDVRMLKAYALGSTLLLTIVLLAGFSCAGRDRWAKWAETRPSGAQVGHNRRQ